MQQTDSPQIITIAPEDTPELIASLTGWRDQLTDTVEQMPLEAFPATHPAAAGARRRA